jgi:ribonucleoside-diphosphate reductase alpha chain
MKANPQAKTSRETGLDFMPMLGEKAAHQADEYEMRDALITNSAGEPVFEQKGLRFPPGFSQMAVNIIASKYFHGPKGSPQREFSFFQLVDRIVDTIERWGTADGYFRDIADGRIFKNELRQLLIGQYVAFNSPVNFNVGCERVEPESQAKNYHWDISQRKITYGIVGYTRPQCSACFINSVQDSMDSILTLNKTEGMLFKWGSGTGTNLSTLRSSAEHLSGGGVASGPVSFMRGFDAFAGVIKSGGTTRRAAKMVILNADHPDIEEFILCKGKEEAKAHALMSCGYDGTSGPESEAYLSVSFQNANNSVRATDEFMELASTPEGHAPASGWDLKAVKDGRTVDTVSAKTLLFQIAKQTWQCGDPGMQFDTTINSWHTCAKTARINASNPCSEYMFLDDTACNLASFNLLKFYQDGVFNVSLLRHAVRILTIAMDIIVDGAGYPTEQIAVNSHDYRPLGLGYANLGALLMEMGYAYDSDEGRNVASAITSVLGGQAYLTSSELAKFGPILPAASEELTTPLGGAFPGYEHNDGSFMSVIAKHREANAEYLRQTEALGVLTDLRRAATQVWQDAYQSGINFGFRNAQVTVLAPTGTIGFMMDCDTTGIEPMMSLVTYKKLVGGGFQKLTYPVVARTLAKLGYPELQVTRILEHIEEKGTVVGSEVKDEHISIFDCALSAPGGRSISWLGHIKMMAAAQPFLSGAISKTVNMPEESTVFDIYNAYIQSWKRGLKAVAIYRDGSKKNQVMVTSKDKVKEDFAPSGLVSHKTLVPILEHLEPGELSAELRGLMLNLLGAASPGNVTERLPLWLLLAEYDSSEIAAALWSGNATYVTDLQGNLLLPGKSGKIEAAPAVLADVDNTGAPPKAIRHKLPDTRSSIIHKFAIANHEGYLHVGLYPDGEVGEIFINMAKEGSTLSGIMDAFATVVSISLQHGVPLAILIDKMAHTRYEPSGWAHDGRIGYAKSITDYLFRWLKLEFVDPKTPPLPADYVIPALVDEPPAEVRFASVGTPISTFDQVATGRYQEGQTAKTPKSAEALGGLVDFGDSPSCSNCGAIMRRAGSCYSCPSCGGTSGCS